MINTTMFAAKGQMMSHYQVSRESWNKPKEQQCCSDLEPLPDELSSRLSLAQCVAVASDRFFKHGEILLVSLPLQEVSATIKSAVLFNHLLFHELFYRSRLSIIIKETKEINPEEKYLKNIDNYVIQVRNVSSLEENLSILQAYASWNPHATFMIVTIVNGVILLPDPNDTSVFETYTWFPYAQHRCGNKFHELELIDKCRYGEFDTGVHWFPNKIPQDLNGCPVRVRTIIWPPFVLPPESKILETEDQYVFKNGLEILLMNTMAEMANFSVVYTISDIVQDWGEISYNGTATGTLLYLRNEQADVAISAFAVSIETHRHFDSIVYALPEALNWCVPHAAVIPQWKNILVVLSIDAIILLLVVYVVISYCIWRLSLSNTKESDFYKELVNCLQSSLSILVNSAVTIQPKSTLVRCLFLLWIFFCLHLSVGYQSSLMGVFAKTNHQKQINTFQEIFENKLKLRLLPTSRRDSATCTPRLYQQFVTRRYVSKDGDPLLYCFKESIVTYPLQMLLWKGYPLKEYFNDLAGRILSSGLITHWIKRILTEQISSDNTIDTEEQAEHFSITITHLYLLFAHLALGYTLAFITLLLEIYVHKRRNRVKVLCKNKLCSKIK
ncbi:hypothetical protein ILUMI_21546 [Ignelater luminosus]|uniref:Ionotropic glutamate receptor C-terminal domain-containing protein n=1 Tax=Ignelater luminosus TaxID=2038154 RepID=A0A8K0FXV7_IGNLU|nr:hypothetical protein ILUMI_21546 [Ignelater luminosus]